MSNSVEWTQEQKQLITEGVAYIDRLQKIDVTKSKLGSEVLYNMVCLGIESVLTGVLLKYDCVIDHSSIFRLLMELEKRESIPLSWKDSAKALARYNTYCSFERIVTKLPTNEELDRFFAFAFDVSAQYKESA